MKNKKKLTMGLSLALVGVLGVGATLAYLSDSTGDLTNTFTFSNSGINLKLDEKEYVDGVFTGERVTADKTSQDTIGSSYKNLIAGQPVSKDPTVTILSNSLNCNVFVSVKNANSKLTIGNIGTWKEIYPTDYNLTGEVGTKYYVYNGNEATHTQDPETNDEFRVVKATGSSERVLDAVFEEVTVSKDITASTVFSDIVIKAAAVQSDYVTDEEAAKTALGMLIPTTQQ